MWREETVEEISDGRYYTADDLVKIGTNDCRGCSDCCRMGPVIVLDPLDVFELNRFLGQSFEELLNETIELKVVDGLILPALKMVKDTSKGSKISGSVSGQEKPLSGNLSVSGDRIKSRESQRRSPVSSGEGCSKEENRTDASQAEALQEEAAVCPYLGEDGRCSIHDFRPGICRLYPLGRSWENGDFRYILQVNECTHCSGSKMKVKKWLGIPNLPAYEAYCRDWHSLLEKVRRLLEGTDPVGTGAAGNDPTGTGLADSNPALSLRNQVCVYLLRQFFLCDWNVDDFYAVFAQRRAEALHHLGFAG